ncbi:MAG: MFS transporter [Nitrososphaerota archaeon]
MPDRLDVRKAVLILIAASFIINLGFSALSPLFPYLVLALEGVLKELPELTAGVIEAHHGALEFGLLMAAFMITRAPMSVFSGFLSDVFGRKRTIVAGMSFYLLATTGFIISQNIPMLIIFRAVQGAGSAMVWPVAQAYLADVTRRWQRGRALSAYVASMLIAELIGPGIGVAIYKTWTAFFGGADYIMAMKSPIIFLALMTLGSLITVIFLPSTPASTNPRIKPGLSEVKAAIKSLPEAVSRSLKIMYLNGAINGFSLGIIEIALIVYMIEFIVKDPAYIGLYYIISSSAALPASLASGYVTDRIRRRKPIITLGYVIGRGTFFLIPFIRDPALFLALAIPSSMTFGISVPAMQALQADLTPKEVRGSIFGIQELFMNGGVLAGSILGGWLTQILTSQTYHVTEFQIQGIALPFWITGALGALTTILFILHVKEPE